MPGIRVTILLADHVAVAEGKLYISGGGWSVTGPGPSPSGLALKLDVPWDMTNKVIKFQLRLLKEDGQPLTQPGPFGEQAVEVGGEFEVGRPPGLKPGTTIDVPLAINIPPLPLTPGKRYSWELSIDGHTNAEWHVAFQTRELPVP